MNTEDIQREFKLLHSRIGAIEERCGCKVKWKESVEKAIRRLDEHYTGYALSEYPVMKKIHERLAALEAKNAVYGGKPDYIGCESCEPDDDSCENCIVPSLQLTPQESICNSCIEICKATKPRASCSLFKPAPQPETIQVSRKIAEEWFAMYEKHDLGEKARAMIAEIRSSLGKKGQV